MFTSEPNSNLGNDQCLLSFLLSYMVGKSTYDWKNVYYNKNFATYDANSITIKKACKISSYSYAFTKNANNAIIYVNENPIITFTGSGLADNVSCDIELNVGDIITATNSLGSSSSHFSISLILG